MTTKMKSGGNLNEFWAPLFSRLSEEQREKVETLVDAIHAEFPDLEPFIAWHQPMWTAHDTFILAMDFAKAHTAFSPEQAGMAAFQEKIEAAGLKHGKMRFNVPWKEPFPLDLIFEMIRFNLKDTEHVTTFWRK